MEVHLKITGYLLIALALLHFVFPRQFKWKDELAGLSLINRQLMYVHTFFIAFMVLLMGVLCVYSAPAITTTALGKQLSLGLGIFWSVRLFFQFFVYSKELWKGKGRETIAHIGFSLLWIYFTLVFFAACR